MAYGGACMLMIDTHGRAQIRTARACSRGALWIVAMATNAHQRDRWIELRKATTDGDSHSDG